MPQVLNLPPVNPLESHLNRPGKSVGLACDKLPAMAVRRVLKMGHPALRSRARALDPGEIGNRASKNLLRDMRDTLGDYGGIGLAAPQIGESLRLAVIEIPGGPTRYGELAPMPFTVFVNPVVEILDQKQAGYWEGCLSVPGLRGFVERPQNIRVAYLSEQGEQREIQLEGFLATVFQHEFDHLDGKLFVDRLSDPKLLAFEKEYERYHLPFE